MINKYYKQQLYKSSDNGATWRSEDVYQKGALYELEGNDCSPRFRTVSGNSYCDGYSKYVDYSNQVSYDGGGTWETIASGTVRVERNSCDCGYEEYLIFFPEERGTFSFTNTVQYSTDGGDHWETLHANQSSPLIDIGYHIMWKANIIPLRNSSVGTFSSTGKFRAEGTPMSLLYGDDFRGQKSLMNKKNIFEGLFAHSKVTDASNLHLPSTALTEYCYSSMFSDCGDLKSAPTLPATTVGDYCYYNMFNGCVSLVIPPALPARNVSNYAYSLMFFGCKSLLVAPELPATNIGNYAYQYMFSGCKRME